MKNSRDNFLEKTKKVLQERVGNRCSNPDCRCLTSGPNNDPEKASRIGVAAHITAAAENGPRYDVFLNKEERTSIFNAIWLCQNCSKLIDSDCERYSTNLLQKWKAHAEELARLELEGKTLKPEQKYEGFYCPHCDTFCKKWVTVCLGCKADIYYGSSQKDWKQDFQTGASLAFILYFFLFMMMPELINSQLGTELPSLWGLPFFMVLATGVIIVVFAGRKHAQRKDLSRKKNPPVFVRGRFDG
jgi:hypothetical protein